MRARVAALAIFASVITPLGARAQLIDRPLFVEVRVPKAPVVASGRSGDWLIYELHATNLEGKPLRWSAAEVLDATTNVSLLTTRDSALVHDLARPGTPGLSAAQRGTIGGGLRGVLYLQVPVAAGRTPTALRHRLTFSDSSGTRTLLTPAVSVGVAAPVLGPPLRGGPWLVGNGPGNGSGHRRTVITLDGAARIAQRFAIDYVMLDSAFRTSRGDSLSNASYYAQGVDVLAVADGVISTVKDGIAENVPGIDSRAVPISLETVGGNHVILDLGGGRFAFYAHVRPGSIRVREGQRVKRGDVLASLGNSGNSTEPHLHFHLGDANAPLGAEGIPYVHETLEFVGKCDSFGAACAWTRAEVKRRVMPFENEIVRFPK
ncbi:MAG: M23 family metallopeptidase [Gemmatimonadetes bacterium]|nr:M23 family metallopeptidase [Gemmatimonadota bacterium]